MIDYATSEPMKYWSMSTTMSPEARRFKLEQLADSGDYLFGIKTDGNWTRAIISPDKAILQTRGISKTTGTYGEVQDKVLFWPDVVKPFNKTTVILGETYLPGGIDKDTGAILRCLGPKALARQKTNPLHWRVFDVLALDGVDYMNTCFEERAKLIHEVVQRIGSPLVEAVIYKEMDDSFFDRMAEIFAAGGEGAVCYRKDSIYVPGKRGPTAWATIKVKQEISSEIDAFRSFIDDAVIPTGRIPFHGIYQSFSKDIENEKISMLSDIDDMIQGIKDHATIDTYARKLYLTRNLRDFRKLKNVLSAFFVWEQLEHKPDNRYDTFLANVLEIPNLNLPKDISIISWNYDSQIETAYQAYRKNLTLPFFEKNLQGEWPTIPNDGRIIKINEWFGNIF